MTEREELIGVINKAFDDCEAPSQQVYSKDIADAILEWHRKKIIEAGEMEIGGGRLSS